MIIDPLWQTWSEVRTKPQITVITRGLKPVWFLSPRTLKHHCCFIAKNVIYGLEQNNRITKMTASLFCCLQINISFYWILWNKRRCLSSHFLVCYGFRVDIVVQQSWWCTRQKATSCRRTAKNIIVRIRLSLGKVGCLRSYYLLGVASKECDSVDAK